MRRRGGWETGPGDGPWQHAQDRITREAALKAEMSRNCKWVALLAAPT